MKTNETTGRKNNKARVTIDSVTFALVRRPNGVTYKDATRIVQKKFPKHDAMTLALTTARRLNGYLAKKYTCEIKADDKGRYKVVASKTNKPVATSV